jgi:hypothetical protein
MSVQIADASIIAAPKQRNTDAEASRPAGMEPAGHAHRRGENASCLTPSDIKTINQTSTVGSSLGFYI